MRKKHKFGSQENQRFTFDRWYAGLTLQQKLDLKFNTEHLYVEDKSNTWLWVLASLAIIAFTFGLYGA